MEGQSPANDMEKLDITEQEPRSTTPNPPTLPPRADKRALLLVYVHGFKGDVTSFKDLPTVSSLLEETNEGFTGVSTVEIISTYSAYTYLSKV